MALNAAELMVKIGADISDLEKGISKAQRKIQNAGRSMQRVGRKLSATVTLPLAAAGGAALKSAAEFESLEQSMAVLNGSVEEGARNFERLKEFSAATPFQLKDLASAQNMLQGFGLAADEAFDSLSMIGDIAAISEGSIKGIGIAFGQAAAEGRLMTRDVRQLINQGVPAIKLLADTMNVAKSDVLDLASQGEISFDILQQAFRDATSAGGMFADGMAKQAQTLSGMWSTFKDNVSIALAEVGQSIAENLDIKELTRYIISNIQMITDWFTSLSTKTQAAMVTLVAVIGAGGPVIWAIGTLATAVSGLIGLFTTLNALVLANPWTIALAGVGLLAAGIYGAYQEQKRFNESIEKLKNVDIDTKPWHELEKRLVKIRKKMRLIAEDANNYGIDPSQVESWRDLNKELQETKNRLAEIKPMGVLKTPGLIFDDLGLGTGVLDQGNEPMVLRPDIKIEPDNVEVDTPTGGAAPKMPVVPFVDPVRGAGEVVKGLQEVKDNIGIPKIEYDLGFPAGSIGYVRDQIQRLNDQIVNATKQAERETLQARKESLEKQLENMQDYGQQSLSFMERFKKGFNEAGNAANLMGEAVTSAFQSMADSGISSLNDLLKVTINTARKIISAEIAKGVAAAVRGALTNVPFPLNIAAAAGAGATAAGLFNSIVPKLAQGGLAFGPTMAVVGDNKGARSNPEVIAPLDKLKSMMGEMGGSQRVEVEGKIRGQDIYFSNTRAKNDWNR